MERRKSKSFSGIEGIRLSYRKSDSRLSSDSSRSYVDGSSKEDMFALDLGKSHVRRSTETSMKKLLAEEMPTEFETKKRRASVLGRLMGLESSASSKHAIRQQKRPSGSYHQQNVLVGRQRSREPCDSFSNRSRSSVDHQEFKDVYEDLEASHLENRHSSRWSASSMLSKADMTLIQQKFIDAKLLSTNKKLQDSKELDDALEMLDSNRDLLMRFLQEPNNLHDHSSSSSVGSQIAVLRPNSTKYKNNYKAQNLQQDTYLKRKDSLLLEPQHRSGTYVSRKASNTQLEEKDDERVHPTQIVILKPSTRRNSRVSPDQGLEFSECGSSRDIKLSRNVGISKPMSSEAREIARRVARRMRNSYDETFDTKSTILKGYAGDESSYSESDSDYESDKLNLLHHKSFGDLKTRRYPSPHVGDSSVNKEGKQRLSERWKMTQRYQDLEMVSKGSTLGEMLSLHDNEIRPKQISAKTSGDNGSGLGYGSYCISSRDGWKDETSRTSNRSRSVPPSIRGENHKKSTHHNASIEDKYLLCSDHNHSGRMKVGKGKISHGGDSSLKDSMSRSKKPFSYHHSFNNGKDIISEANFEIKMEANIKDLSEQKPIFQIAEGDGTSVSPFSDVEIIAEHEGKTTLHDSGNSSFQEPNEELSEQTPFVKSEVGGEPGSSRKPTEANRTSPVSVHETLFTEDLSSSSEGFERLGAELHDLRMKLRLLKMESGTYTEASTSLTPTEEHTHSEVNHYHFSATEDWEISYALDILQESGIEDFIFDTFKSKWHSQDCPLDVKLFDELENIYNDETTCTSSERKLVFDRTNLAILEIWQENVDLFPWVKPKLTGFSSIKPNDGVGVVLEKVMIDDDYVLDKEMQWSDCKEEIDAVGNGIEEMLVDEMIVEVFM